MLRVGSLLYLQFPTPIFELLSFYKQFISMSAVWRSWQLIACSVKPWHDLYLPFESNDPSTSACSLAGTHTHQHDTIHTYEYTHARTHARTHTSARAHTHTHTHIHTRVHTRYTHTRVHTQVRIHTRHTHTRDTHKRHTHTHTHSHTHTPVFGRMFPQ